MKKVIVLFIVVLGMAGAASASAEENGSPASGARTYVVQYRDSVEKVARQFGVTVEEIISANPRAVSRRPICVDERAWTLQSGTVVTTCRRVEHWFRRAGMIITIPVSRAALESETSRLNAELAALRAERDEARQERDRLAAQNEELLRAKQEPPSRHDEPEQGASTNSPPAVTAAACPANPRRAPDEVSDDDTTIYVLLLTLLLAVIVVLYQHYKPSKSARRLAKQTQVESVRVVRERTELEATRKVVAREAGEVSKARRWLEEERMEFETKQREFETRVTEVTRSLVERETNVRRRESVPPIFQPCGRDVARVKAELLFLNLVIIHGRQLLAEEERKLREREAQCASREEVLRALGVTLANRGRTPCDEGGDDDGADEDDTVRLSDSDARALADEGATSSDEEIICAICRDHFPDRRAFEEHKSDCKNAFPHTPTIRPMKGKPAARTGSRPTFYCTVCSRHVPLDEQDEHNAAHAAQETLGPLPSRGGEEK